MCILPLCICSLSITQHMCTYMHAFILFFSLSVFALNVYCSYVQWNVYIIRIKLRICASWLALVLSLNMLLEIQCFFLYYPALYVHVYVFIEDVLSILHTIALYSYSSSYRIITYFSLQWKKEVATKIFSFIIDLNYLSSKVT